MRPEINFFLSHIQQKAEALASIAHKHQVNVLIAVKASPLPHILATVKESIQGFDISNSHEFTLTTGLGFHFITNCPLTDLDFVQQMNKGQYLISCSSSHYHQEIARMNLPFVLRLQSTDLITEKSNFKSRFGFTREQVLELKDRLQNDSNFSGFHFHHGSDKNTVGTYKSAIYGIKKLILELGIQKNLTVNLGGGFINLTLNGIDTVLKYARQELGQHALYIEPGRYFTEGTGKCICEVTDMQIRGDELTANLNISRECHLKWSHIEKIEIIKKSETVFSRNAKSITFYGNTCYEHDIIATGHDPQVCTVDIGDTVVLSNVSGYSFAWNTSFNGVPAIDYKFV